MIMKKLSLIALVLTASVIGTQAKSWKVGPSSVVGMDFASINDAMSKVSAGDTLYLDQYYIEGSEQDVTKRVVIIGTGYDISLTDEQVVATLTNTLNLKANKVVVKSVKLSKAFFYGDDCTLERCYATYIHTASSTAGMNHIYSCFIEGYTDGYEQWTRSKLDIQNSVIVCDSSHDNIQSLTSSIIKNNVIIHNGYYNKCLSYIDNTEIADNIILHTGSSNSDFGDYILDSGLGNAIEHNVLSRTSAIELFPNNKTGFSIASVFLQEGTFSDYYRLLEDSPLATYATDGGEVGCHGGMFGCPSGGRPQYIPYFTKVTVGSRVENGKLPVSVTIKIQDE